GGWTGPRGRAGGELAGGRGRPRHGQAAGLRLRADQLRRDRRGRAGGSRLLAGPGEDRAVRGDRRTLMDALDGNAIGGLLIDVFGAEMTAATGTCGACGDTGPVAPLVV